MKHHLDDLIEKMENDDVDLNPYMLILVLLKEVKRLDENHEQLSDWVHDYDA
jgi:hypothetical protein